jgi:hypothetical protein
MMQYMGTLSAVVESIPDGPYVYADTEGGATEYRKYDTGYIAPQGSFLLGDASLFGWFNVWRLDDGLFVISPCKIQDAELLRRLQPYLDRTRQKIHHA